MKLTCAQMLEYIKLMNPPEDKTECDDFYKSLIQRTINVNILPDFLNSITKIDDYAFYGCGKLELTSLPDGITSIGNSAFASCNNLALTNLPDGLTNIEESAFMNCTRLANVSIPASVTNIGHWAFGYCRFSTITFKGTPTSISSDAFFECTRLTAINVPWSEGEVAGAPWGATNATINYNYTG